MKTNPSRSRAACAALLMVACSIGAASAHSVENRRCELRNKFWQGEVTSSQQPWGGDLAHVTDCVRDHFVNLPAYTGWFTITTATDQCYSKFAGVPSMLPDGPVSIDIILSDANGVELLRQNFNRHLADQTTSFFPLGQSVCGVRSVTFDTLSSPSWVAWYELVGR